MFVDRRPGRLLDVGCGKGDLLAEMKKKGWVVQGLEFDKKAAAAARALHGIDVLVGNLQDVQRLGVRYDVISMSHVIEHVPHPVRFLQEAKGLLAPDGVIALKTPNAASYGHMKFGRNWRGLEVPRHLNIFTEEALRKCAVKAGFESCRTFTSPVHSGYILRMSYYLREIGAGHGGPMQRVLSNLVSPILAIKARAEYARDPKSGEEIVAMLRH